MPTQAQFAKHFGVSTPAVCDLMARGIVPRDASLEDGCKAYTKHLREKAAGRGEGEDDGELTREKTRLTKAQADKVELEVEELRGALVRVEAVERERGDLVAAARAKLLSLPGKAAPLVMASGNLLEAERIIKNLVYEALTELARGTDESADQVELEDPADLEPASRADDKPVVRRKPKAKPRRQRRARPVQ